MLKVRDDLKSKRIMKIKMFFIGVVCLLTVNGCISSESDKYTNQNPITDITTIQIMYNEDLYGEGVDEDKIRVIYELKQEEVEEFMNDICDLETEVDRRHPPFWGWGKYVAKITYKNGDIEMLGSEVIEYRKKGDSSLPGYGKYRFKDQDDFIRVLEKYCSVYDVIDDYVV